MSTSEEEEHKKRGGGKGRRAKETFGAHPFLFSFFSASSFFSFYFFFSFFLLHGRSSGKFRAAPSMECSGSMKGT